MIGMTVFYRGFYENDNKFSLIVAINKKYVIIYTTLWRLPMYQKLYIDNNIENLITDEIRGVFNDYAVPFSFIEDSSIADRNALYLTNDKDRLSDKLINVFLLSEEYDFLDVKNAIFIKNIEDIVNVIKNDVWKNWAQELQFLAQCSLAYSKDRFLYQYQTSLTQQYNFRVPEGYRHSPEPPHYLYEQ